LAAALGIYGAVERARPRHGDDYGRLINTTSVDSHGSVDSGVSQSRIGTQYVIDCTNGALGSRSGTFLTEFNVGAWHNITFRNTSGVGTYMYWNVDVDQGTYDVQIFTLHNSYGGQFTVKRTGVAIGGTIDTYAAASTPSVDTITGVTFAQGVAMIRLDVTGKNASASSYTIQLTKIILTRVS